MRRAIRRAVRDRSDQRDLLFEFTTRPNIVWAHIDELDLSAGAPVKKLDLVGDVDLQGGLTGDVTSRFEESEPMDFLAAAA